MSAVSLRMCLGRTHLVGVIIPAPKRALSAGSALSGCFPVSLSRFAERGTHESGVALYPVVICARKVRRR